MAAEYATCTRHHKISTKITNEMRVSQIELITQMSGYIKWLSIDKNAFYKYEKTYVLMSNFETKYFLFLFHECISTYVIFFYNVPSRATRK